MVTVSRRRQRSGHGRNAPARVLSGPPGPSGTLLVRAALILAEDLLGDVDDRWAHVRTAARLAERAGVTVAPQERGVLVAAAALHDIGYAHAARDTGFHPLDGARLLSRLGWPARIVALVAHHSLSVVQAQPLGHAELIRAFPDDSPAVVDALIYADMLSAPDGREVTLEERLADMAERHLTRPPAVRRAGALRRPLLREAVGRVELRLSHVLDAR